MRECVRARTRYFSKRPNVALYVRYGQNARHLRILALRGACEHNAPYAQRVALSSWRIFTDET